MVYFKKLDQVWISKIEDDPTFSKDFNDCRNDFEIAQFIKKHLSQEIDWYVKQLKNEWTTYLLTNNSRFAEDRNMLSLALKKCRRHIQSGHSESICLSS